MGTDTFTMAPNKYPGACHYCARRVRAKEGVCWPDAGCGKHVAAHVQCVSDAVGRGKPPQVGTATRGGGVSPAVQAETRAAVGLSPAGLTAAATLRALRKAIQRVAVTSPEAEVLAALADARALLAAPVEAVEAWRGADGLARDQSTLVGEAVPF